MGEYVLWSVRDVNVVKAGQGTTVKYPAGDINVKEILIVGVLKLASASIPLIIAYVNLVSLVLLVKYQMNMVKSVHHQVVKMEDLVHLLVDACVQMVGLEISANILH